MKTSSPVPWTIVSLVGVAILALVFGLGLFNRLESGQELLDEVSPAFTAERAAGARGGVDAVSTIVDFAGPVIDSKAKASQEIPVLIGQLSEKTGLSEREVIAALGKDYPHTAALLQAVPLSGITRELPQLVAFLASALDLSPEQVQAALAKNVPALAQAITALPNVTGGWHAVPGTEEFTAFDGAAVRSAPQVRDYFSADLVPVVERQQENMIDLTEHGGIGFVPYLLLMLGIAVTFFGAVNAIAARRRQLGHDAELASWGIVAAVGGGVIVLVLALSLVPRLQGGDELLSAARPAFAEQRLVGAEAGVAFVGEAAALTDPIVDAEGGAAGEVPKLVAFVSDGTGLSNAEVLGVLQQKFPQTAALLSALPLSEVTAELPGVQRFLASSLGVSQEQLAATLEQDLPGLNQVLTALPVMTDGYREVPGTEQLTRFDGAPARSVPEVAGYFAGDVVPALGSQRENFEALDDPWPPVTVFAPLLLAVGAAVLLFGIAMFLRTQHVPPAARAREVTRQETVSTA